MDLAKKYNPLTRRLLAIIFLSVVSPLTICGILAHFTSSLTIALAASFMICAPFFLVSIVQISRVLFSEITRITEHLRRQKDVSFTEKFCLSDLEEFFDLSQAVKLQLTQYDFKVKKEAELKEKIKLLNEREQKLINCLQNRKQGVQLEEFEANDQRARKIIEQLIVRNDELESKFDSVESENQKLKTNLEKLFYELKSKQQSFEFEQARVENLQKKLSRDFN